MSGLFRAHYRHLSACRVGGGHLHYRIREIRGGFSLRDICLCVLEHQQPNHRNKCWQRTSLQTADTLTRLHSFMLWLGLDRKEVFGLRDLVSSPQTQLGKSPEASFKCQNAVSAGGRSLGSRLRPPSRHQLQLTYM